MPVERLRNVVQSITERILPRKDTVPHTVETAFYGRKYVDTYLQERGRTSTPDPEIHISIGHELLADGFYVIAPFSADEFSKNSYLLPAYTALIHNRARQMELVEDGHTFGVEITGIEDDFQRPVLSLIID